ncbi:MAG TPA: SpoIVB peptidase S55 domain-containing protein, partial [Candidatus Sulfotelmatobacter sp.]|nr:SpoIVB peptidase S55 domain-containing protein [Candidatus Sulfotelmatobacter sp.]
SIGCSMKKAVSLSIVLFVFLGFAQAQQPSPQPAKQELPQTQIMKVDDVRPGMKGIGYTVFQGTQPEPMGVEVLGVLRNLNGPKSDVVLVRLKGEKAEYTGVVAGMSGSPVYIDGKLLGAIAYRIGQFSKEPIAGVTPIEQMLEINEFDASLPAAGTATTAKAFGATKTSTPGVAESNPVQSYAQYLQPIDAPFVFNGFNEAAIRQFAPSFAAAGITPVMGVGSASKEKQPEPLAPGSAISAIMVRGDMDVAATCTVTYMDKDHLLACGHPLTQYGMINMPMTKANVVATLASPMNAFKIVNTTEAVGAFVQDRHTGIMGTFGREPQMIPVTLSIHGSSGPREYHYEVLNNAKLTPLMMMATVYNALMGMNQYGEETTYRMNGRIHVNGFSDVRMTNMFSPVDATPTAYAVAMSLGDHFGRIYENPFEAPTVSGVTLEFDLERERHSAALESARTDVTEARPGDEIMIEAVLRPYRGERIVRRIPVRVPTSVPKGTLRILVSDAETLDRSRRVSPAMGRRLDLHSTIELLNKEHLNDHLYVSLLEANPQATVEDKVMPGVPLSVMNVMEGMRATQEMVVFNESAVNESSTPVGYVVNGAQIISLSIK